jgi:putative transposase
MSESYTYAGKHPTAFKCSTVYGISQRENAMMIFEWHASLKYRFGNRNFWAIGYYVSTVAINASTVQKYI